MKCSVFICTTGHNIIILSWYSIVNGLTVYTLHMLQMPVNFNGLTAYTLRLLQMPVLLGFTAKCAIIHVKEAVRILATDVLENVPIVCLVGWGQSAMSVR